MSCESSEIQKVLIGFINQLTNEDGTFDPSSNLFDMGIIDSFQILEIMTFLEDKFSAEIDVAKVTQEDFQSVEKMELLVKNMIDTKNSAA